MITFHLADAVQWAKDYDGPLFHGLFADAPYHLTSIVKRFGKSGAAAAKPGIDGAFGRVSRGFMGQTWDGGDVAFKSDTWSAFLRVLHPGAFCAVFGGSRGFHRMMVAIEDAGFVIHPALFGWAYGSGLPKATRVKKDDRFKGHRYGLQALKPALEPIVIFQKPYDGRPLSNIVETGAGTLNIDGTRIPLQEGESYVINRYDGLRPFGGGDGEYSTEKGAGRWASNFVLLDQGAADRLDLQSGYLKSGKPSGTRKALNGVIYGQYAPGTPITGFGDAGGASRFFFQVRENIDSADPVKYAKKASRSEKDLGLDQFPFVVVDGVEQNFKNPHPTVKALDLTKYLATLLLPPAEYSPRRLFVPFSGVGSECIGASMAGWDEIEGVEITAEYIPVAEARAEYWSHG